MQIGQKGIKLNIGDKIHFQSPSTIHPEAIYEGVVMEKYSTYYRVLATPIRDTMHEDQKAFWKEATPYYHCINKYTDWNERVKVVDKLTDVNFNILKQYISELTNDVDMEMSA